MTLAEVAADFKKLSVLLDRSTVSVNSGKKQLTPSQHTAMQRSAREIINRPKLPDWDMAASEEGDFSSAAMPVLLEHRNILRSFDVFVQAAVAQLSTSSQGSTKTNVELRELLPTLLFPLLTLNLIPLSWDSAVYMSSHRQLYRCLNTLATFFSAIPSLRKRKGLAIAGIFRSKAETPGLLLLQTITNCLCRVRNPAESEVISAFPDGFTDTLCSLACQELRPYLFDPAAMSARGDYWKVLIDLLSFMTGCIVDAHSDDPTILQIILSGPAVLESAKMLMLAFCTTGHQSEIDHSNVSAMLLKLFEYSLAIQGSCPRIVSEPTPLARQLTTQLIAALRTLSQTSPATVPDNTRLLSHLLSSAINELQIQDAPSVCELDYDTLGAAHHCSVQVLIWQRKQQQQQMRRRSTRSEQEASPVQGLDVEMQFLGQTNSGILDLRRLLLSLTAKTSAVTRTGKSIFRKEWGTRYMVSRVTYYLQLKWVCSTLWE